MQNRIIKLDSNLINKIAAGEVIERPASVVKELIENSIDAGALNIVVVIKDGGKSLIKVVDDGCGIHKDDIAIAVMRHTTSKLKDIDDLFRITSLGFRGEALASIASVSHTTIQSKTADEYKDEYNDRYNLGNPSNSDTLGSLGSIISVDSTKKVKEGFMVEVEDGRIINEKPVACNKGTIVEVRNLFFNMPARKKYMKSIGSEFGQIIDAVARYALINLEIHFTLIHNDKLVLNSPAQENMINNIISIYGRKIAKELIPIDFSFFGINITGFISKPSYTRADKNYQSIYINKRCIKNYSIQKAVYDGYGRSLLHGRHPVFIISILLDPAKVDVNVHPTKNSVRFEKEEQIYQITRDAVINALKANGSIPEADDIGHRETNTMLVVGSFEQQVGEQSYLFEVADADGNSAVNLSKSRKITPMKIPLKIVGRMHNTYIIGEDKDGFVIIDQHAAHERVLFERFMRQIKDDCVKVQILLKPEVIELSANERHVVAENIDALKKMGIEMEEFGKNTYVLRALPSVLSMQQKKSFAIDIIDELGKGNEPAAAALIKEERAAMAACRAAVKAHDILEIPQLYKLLEDLFACDNPNNCPHGRPTMIRFDISELEKKFKRIV